MEQGYLYPFGSFFAHALQDNSDLFWYPLNAYNAPTPPITISMSTTRIVSPPAAAGIGVGALLSNPNSNPSPNPNSASHSHSHQSRSRSRAQRPIHLGIDEQVGGGGGAGSQRIRPTASLPLPLPFTLPLPPLMSTSRRRRHRRSSTPTITTQQPRLSATPPPPQNNTQTPPRLRSTNLSLANVELPPINFWESEPLESHHGSGLEPSGFDDNFLLDLATAEFSSPSTYPSFTDFNSQPTQAQGVDQSHRQNRYSTLQAPTSPEPSRAFLNGASNAPRRLSTNCISNILGPERSTTQLSSTTNTTGESQSTLPFFDSLEENDFLFDSPASSFSDAMPPATRRTTTAATAAARAGSGHASKRRRTSTTAANTISTRPPSRQKKTPAPSKDMEVEELFGPSPTRTFVDLEAKEEDIDTVDLTETNEVLDDPKTPEKDNRIKLAAFQCVICMDDCVNLTVTHCGHLYCASCLHQSLHVDATKGKCPMCRQKLDMRQRNNYNSKTKGYWPLELKLMTATRKGKRKANTLA